MRLTVLLVVIIATGAGCTSQPPQIAIEGQYANLSPLFIGAGSVFFEVRNDGGSDAMVRATVAVPNAVVEFHDVRDSRMVRVEKIPVPSRSVVDLKPGGQHLMIFNLPKTTKEGSEIVLTLTFERSGEMQVPVRFIK